MAKKTKFRRSKSGGTSVKATLNGLMALLKRHWLTGVIAIAAAAFAVAAQRKLAPNQRFQVWAFLIAVAIPAVSLKIFKQKLGRDRAVLAAATAAGLVAIWNAGAGEALASNRVTRYAVDAGNKLASFLPAGFGGNGGGASYDYSRPTTEISAPAPTVTPISMPMPTAPRPQSSAEKWATIGLDIFKTGADVLSRTGVLGVNGSQAPYYRQNGIGSSTVDANAVLVGSAW